MKLITICLSIAVITTSLIGQEVRWLHVGSLTNFYMSPGSEIELALGSQGKLDGQQNGLRWPSIYQYQDMQAAKGMWIGVKDFTDQQGSYAHKVVHIGPRVRGDGEFFPARFKMISKYEPPQTFVDGNPSYTVAVSNDSVDPALKSDRMIDNIVHTSIGITMQRKIHAFSQQFHDNYFIHDYTFTNSGIVGIVDKAEIKRDTATLYGVYFYFQYRLAVNADIRYVVGINPVGWGLNTMNDTRGDTTNPGVATTFFPGNLDNDIRAQISWHGKASFGTFPPGYDNIGAPIWTPYYDKTDTTGRLGGSQFVGIATLHADKSATDTTDDFAQPSTTAYEGSDAGNNRDNSQYNNGKMTSEYGWMSKGHMIPRHADKVGLNGFPEQANSDGGGGGFSFANGYGPYTLKPGEKIRIVMAEGASGLTREANIEIGKAYKANPAAPITYNGITKTKNEWVYTGRDSLFKTFRRAIANFNSGYTISQPPLPPKIFNVNSGAGAIKMTWETYGADPALKGFEIYRAIGRSDSTYHKVFSGDASARSFSDTSAALDVAHYYYIISVGDAAQNTGVGQTSGALVSNRYYTQTYDAAYRKLLASTALVASNIRIVPNPYHIGGFLYPSEQDKIVFKNIPAFCTIKIYSELGELIRTLDHNDGTGSEQYDLTTSSKQVIVSGVYIAVIESPKGERAIKKFIVIR